MWLRAENMSLAQAIRDRVAAKDWFSLAEVHRWMADDSDLELWAALYEVLGQGFYRIKPEPDMEETCEFITRYLLRCIHEDVTSELVPTGFEAARDLANCLKLWASKLPETESVMSDAAQRIADAYAFADERERYRLLFGMLEHALEASSIRPFFQGWASDATLAEPWRLAMELAVDHTDPAAR